MIQPNLSPVPWEDQYYLNDDYTIMYGDIKIVVPWAFTFDGASIPSIGWRLTYTPFHPKVMAPALTHDWPYLTHQVPREVADQMFYDRLILNGADPKKARWMHWAVEKFGGAHWERNQKDIKKLQKLYPLIKDSPRFNEYCFPVDVLTI